MDDLKKAKNSLRQKVRKRHPIKSVQKNLSIKKTTKTPLKSSLNDISS